MDGGPPGEEGMEVGGMAGTGEEKEQAVTLEMLEVYTGYLLVRSSFVLWGGWSIVHHITIRYSHTATHPRTKPRHRATRGW